MLEKEETSSSEAKVNTKVDEPSENPRKEESRGLRHVDKSRHETEGESSANVANGAEIVEEVYESDFEKDSSSVQEILSD